ncbi:ATP-binding protein [Desulfobulbus rhabdoformis]|uniref:ATP-binding protein n=1 Tax=Desulfobulbus rhabdoformis TaxID=34032 RepID=UPI0019649E4B|nr:ATP-binding protein [Desulfobulbus rhabdoformis]MBM9613165.1 ATP-binding protein [Desulfobulbus rhabdoformis]
MNMARNNRLDQLDPEWRRLELLCWCLSKGRRGEKPGDDELQQLRDLQAQVHALRGQDGGWQSLLELELHPLEFDILAAVLAPELEPRIGWSFQNLQAGLSQPWATRSLMQELFALDVQQAAELRGFLGPHGTLRRRRLIRCEQEGPYAPIVPEPVLIGCITGITMEIPPPPGATPVHQQAGWDDLVLPASKLAMLKEYLLWIEQRETVVHSWQGQPVGGPVALFTGPSGTGKTFAASVLAGSLGWQLFRVDLGCLVSKYVGETEENLNKLFDAAHNQPMVLQFDEADALFAKRGEVKEARDRYANMEVSHLLSRIEAHNGPCILTTNLRKQLDGAFTRRFQMVVDFPRPDAEARAALWSHLLPPKAPLDPQVESAFIGGAVALTGGSIRNAALHAAYLAAGAELPIGLAHIAHAIWRELGKEGREIQLQDLGPLAEYLPSELVHEY